jgi:O-antigen/teichoic acid export membrane protein
VSNPSAIPPRATGTAKAVFGALRWNVSVRTAAQIMTWATTLVIARVLTPSDYGLLGMAQMLVSFCLLLSQLGVVPALVQQPDLSRPLLRQAFALVLLSNVAFYLILYATAPWIATFFGEPVLVDIIRVAALILPITAFSAVPGALLQRDLNYKSLSLTEFAAAVIGALAILALVLTGYGVWGLVIGNLVVAAVTTLGFVMLTRFFVWPQFRFSGLRHTLKFGMTYSVAGLVSSINASMPGLVIGKGLGSTDLGFYTMMYDIAMLPLNRLMRLTGQIAFSGYSRIQNDITLARRYFFESAQLLLLLVFPVAWGMLAVAPDMITVVLGPQWLPSVLVFQIIALGVPIQALGPIMSPLVSGLGRPDIALRNTLTGAVILPPAAIAGLPWGLTGVCIGALLGVLLTASVVLRRNFAVIKANLGQLFWLYAPPAVSAGVMAGAVVLAEATVLSALPSVWRLASAVLLGAVVYSLLTFLVNRAAVRLVLQLVVIRRTGSA